MCARAIPAEAAAESVQIQDQTVGPGSRLLGYGATFPREVSVADAVAMRSVGRGGRNRRKTKKSSWLTSKGSAVSSPQHEIPESHPSIQFSSFAPKHPVGRPVAGVPHARPREEAAVAAAAAASSPTEVP